MSIESIAEKVAGVVGRNFAQPSSDILRGDFVRSLATGLDLQTGSSRWTLDTVVAQHSGRIVSGGRSNRKIIYGNHKTG